MFREMFITEGTKTWQQLFKKIGFKISKKKEKYIVSYGNDTKVVDTSRDIYVYDRSDLDDKLSVKNTDNRKFAKISDGEVSIASTIFNSFSDTTREKTKQSFNDNIDMVDNLA